mmetsp:Transcript_866/g.2196  ORF Transcript_866/g.2196 Transcript_866/m.2196 type:complete len:325 (-) Transcript_866:132-1106(-)
MSDTIAQPVPVEIQELNCQEIFNLPLSERFVVLDTRDRAAYERCHLPGAWSATGVADAASLRAVLDRVWTDNPPEKLCTTVVVGESSAAASMNPDDAAVVLAKLLQQVATSTWAEVSARKAQPDLRREAIMGDEYGPERMLTHLRTVALFRGTAALSTALPGITVTGAEPGLPAPILPVMILPPAALSGGPHPALYLGSQTHASRKSALQLLGITHVCNATVEVPNFFEDNEGMTYLRCRLRDDFRQSLDCAFAASHEFLAGTTRPTLVHCARGANRSAALVAHHLLRSGVAASPQEAITIVKHCRQSPLTLRNFNFVQQLHEL